MSEKTVIVAIMVIMFTLALVMGGSSWADGYRVGYRQGQIDYHDGKIMYCLSVDDLAQTIWEECNVAP